MDILTLTIFIYALFLTFAYIIMMFMIAGSEKESKKQLEYWKQEAIDYQNKYTKEQERNSTVVSQKQSALVKTGAMVENIIPLLQELPYDSNNMHHLGKPIDYLYFDYDSPEIVFLEVKTGQARESKRQKIIKNCIKKGLVRYEKLQINENGIKIISADNEK